MEYRVAEYSKYKELGGKGDWSNGILKVDLFSWNEFHNVTEKLLDLGDFIWRGQINDWPLISKFDRMVKSNREAKLKIHMKDFLRAIKGRRGNNPPELDKTGDIWSLGQHYGLVTPLLDWTESPFVAAYFAFKEKSFKILQNAMITVMLKGSEKKKQKESVLKSAPSRFIYGLSKDIVRWGPSKSEGSGPYAHFIKFVEPLSDENARLLNQKGLFTIPMSGGIEIEKTVKRCYSADKKKGRSRIIFVKIQIPEIVREICLRNLNRMNINHATLFPDLIGAADYCNLKLEIDNYA